MTFIDKVYTLRTEVCGDGKTSYFISFTDGQGEFSIWRYWKRSISNFGKWSVRTAICNNPTGGTRSHQTCGMKRSISGRSECPKVLRN